MASLMIILVTIRGEGLSTVLAAEQFLTRMDSLMLQETSFILEDLSAGCVRTLIRMIDMLNYFYCRCCYNGWLSNSFYMLLLLCLLLRNFWGHYWLPQSETLRRRFGFDGAFRLRTTNMSRMNWMFICTFWVIPCLINLILLKQNLEIINFLQNVFCFLNVRLGFILHGMNGGLVKLDIPHVIALVKAKALVTAVLKGYLLGTQYCFKLTLNGVIL